METCFILIQFSRILDSQFRPKREGPCPSTTISGRLALCPSYSTCTYTCPSTFSLSPVYVTSDRSTSANVRVGNDLSQVSFEVMEYAAPVSSSMTMGTPFTCTSILILSSGFPLTVLMLNMGESEPGLDSLESAAASSM